MNTSESKKEYQKQWRLNNPDYQKNWKSKNPEYHKEYRIEWLKDHPNYTTKYARTEHAKAKRKIYYELNKEKIGERNKAYMYDRLKTDPLFKMICNVRNLIKNAIHRKYTAKSKKATDILGCDYDTLVRHIESQFDEFMNWDNYGTYWEFDHIIQLQYAKTFEDVIRLNHYTNLRPLEINENRTRYRTAA